MSVPKGVWNSSSVSTSQPLGSDEDGVRGGVASQFPSGVVEAPACCTGIGATGISRSGSAHTGFTVCLPLSRCVIILPVSRSTAGPPKPMASSAASLSSPSSSASPSDSSSDWSLSLSDATKKLEFLTPPLLPTLLLIFGEQGIVPLR